MVILVLLSLFMHHIVNGLNDCPCLSDRDVIVGYARSSWTCDDQDGDLYLPESGRYSGGIEDLSGSAFEECVVQSDAWKCLNESVASCDCKYKYKCEGEEGDSCVCRTDFGWFTAGAVFLSIALLSISVSFVLYMEGCWKKKIEESARLCVFIIVCFLIGFIILAVDKMIHTIAFIIIWCATPFICICYMCYNKWKSLRSQRSTARGTSTVTTVQKQKEKSNEPSTVTTVQKQKKQYITKGGYVLASAPKEDVELDIVERKAKSKQKKVTVSTAGDIPSYVDKAPSVPDPKQEEADIKPSVPPQLVEDIQSDVTWIYKQMWKWSNTEVFDWAKSVNLGNQLNHKVLDEIKSAQCTGKDIRSLATPEHVRDAFGIVNNNALCDNILFKIVSFKPEAKAKDVVQKRFKINIFSQQNHLVLNEEVTKNETVQYIKVLYKIQSGVATNIDDIYFYYKYQLLESEKTLEQVNIMNDQHLLTVKFGTDGIN